MEHFAKIIMPEFRHGTRKFLVQGKFCGTMSLWLTFHKKNKKKKDPTGKHFGVFSPRYIKTAFWMKNLTQRWTQSGPFPRIIPLFLIFKKKGRWGHLYSPPPPNCTPASAAEYASISLNIPKYLWKCLKKQSWLCHCYEDAWSSYMFNRILKMPWVLNVGRFWIWHHCICKGYAEFWICLNMVQYA